MLHDWFGSATEKQGKAWNKEGHENANETNKQKWKVQF